jgi:antitoxin HigA-1
MNNSETLHPGKILYNDFLVPLGLSAYKLSKDIGIPQTRISEVLKGNRRITADTALRLSKYLGTTAKYWLGLQSDFDIREHSKIKESELDAIKQYKSNAA